MEKAGKITLFSLLIFSICLLSVEGVVRGAKLAPGLIGGAYYGPDPVLPFRGRPHIQYRVRSEGEYDTQVRHNSRGFRDREHDRTPSPTAIRILGLGDSFTVGGGAEFEETYLAQLERILNGREGHPLVEVVNFGVSRYWTEPERLYWPKDGHGTPSGYRVIAQETARTLMEQGWVP